MKGKILLGLCVSSVVSAQVDSLQIHQIQQVKFTKKLPISQQFIRVERDLATKNLAQDLPILLKNQVSVLSSSDAGNGVGYTDFRIRGVAGNSVNVMLNGIPYNDSESQGTFFVNVSDLVSSASQIHIQRGVGTSANGVAAFGASVNILTKNPSENFYFLTNQSYGSYDTHRHSLELGTGDFWNKKLSLMARYSLTKSDGYVDRAFSDLKSYNVTALFKTEKARLKFLAFGGKEKTYQAWNGVDLATYEKNRTYNFSGEVYDNLGNVSYYDNETDNYQQSHYHLILNQKLSDFWDLETTFHYTKGRGFYENYKQNQRFSKYNLQFSGRTDFIRKKWLDNDFYGLVYQLYGKYDRIKLHFGGAGNQYFGRHFGQVNSVQNLPNIPQDHEYYRNHSTKNDISSFGKIIFSAGKWDFFGDVQFRHIHHFANVLTQGDGEGGDFSRVFNFVNPKAGINLNFKQGKAYFSYAMANREPNRDDILAKNDVQHETLHDFELGVEKSWQNFSFFANAYYMNYQNQLVFSGKIDNVGAFLRENSGKSYRRGLEFGINFMPLKNIQILANANFSQNRNLDFRTEQNGILKNFGTTKIALSPDFMGNLKLSFNPNKFTFSLQNQYVSKQYLDNTENENLAIPGYIVTDFLASYRLDLQHHQLNIYFNLNNLFNKMYVSKGYVYDQIPYFFPQAGRSFMLGITWLIQ